MMQENMLQETSTIEADPLAPPSIPASESGESAGGWGSWAAASWKQAVEVTEGALDMTENILTSAAAELGNGNVVSDEENSEEGDEEAANASEEKESNDPAEGLLKSFATGWSLSSVTSSVAEKAKASIKQAENLVESSMESLKKADDYGASVVQKTQASIQRVVNSEDGWSEEDVAVEKPEGDAEKDLEVENLEAQDSSEEDLYEFR